MSKALYMVTRIYRQKAAMLQMTGKVWKCLAAECVLSTNGSLVSRANIIADMMLLRGAMI